MNDRHQAPQAQDPSSAASWLPGPLSFSRERVEAGVEYGTNDKLFFGMFWSIGWLQVMCILSSLLHHAHHGLQQHGDGCAHPSPPKLLDV